MGTALSIYESMESADPTPYFEVVTCTYCCTFVLYALVGALGYAGWGAAIESVVLYSLPAGALAETAQICVSIVLFLSFALQVRAPRPRRAARLASPRPRPRRSHACAAPRPLPEPLALVAQMTPVFHIGEDLLLASEHHGGLPPRAWPAVRTITVALAGLAAYVIPDMEKVVQLTGSVALSGIGFILPGLFFLKLRPPPATSGQHAPPGQATACEVATAIALVALGTVGGVFSVYSELFASR